MDDDHKVKLNGESLTRQQVIDVALYNYKVEIDTSKIEKSRQHIVQKVQQKKIIYGVTTGFGSNIDKMIGTEDTLKLQVNLLRSHATGVGKPFSKEIVRAIMLIRLNTLLKGYSGVQKSTVAQITFLLNHQIHPVILEKGSVGASGDLCPLSHMALPLIGEGEIEFQGKVYQTIDFRNTTEAQKISFKPIDLSYKEGLALNNGTTVMAAVGTIALHKAERLLKIGTLASALIFESLCARADIFSFEDIHRVRNHRGQIEIASWLEQLLAGSKLIDLSQAEIVAKLTTQNLLPDELKAKLIELYKDKPADEHVPIPNEIINTLLVDGRADLVNILKFARLKWKPQDSYSIRCIPQVFGASKTALDHVISVVENELNAAVDNPLIFAEQDKIISGGNFHGQPLALIMDYLKLAIAEIGNITERQINKMVDGNTNDCLPTYLTESTGLNNGIMICQYVAAALVSENKVLVHPASADSIPTGQNTEDHVSMGSIAARQALEIVENVEDIIAIAIMTGFYAVNLRMQQFKKVNLEAKPERVLALTTYNFYRIVEKSNPEFQKANFTATDRFLAPELRAIKKSFENFEELFTNAISESKLNTQQIQKLLSKEVKFTNIDPNGN